MSRLMVSMVRYNNLYAEFPKMCGAHVFNNHFCTGIGSKLGKMMEEGPTNQNAP